MKPSIPGPVLIVPTTSGAFPDALRQEVLTPDVAVEVVELTMTMHEQARRTRSTERPQMEQELRRVEAE